MYEYTEREKEENHFLHEPHATWLADLGLWVAAVGVFLPLSLPAFLGVTSVLAFFADTGVLGAGSCALFLLDSAFFNKPN